MLTVPQIKQIVADYFKDKPVKEVYLFGSYARGEAREDSDVDLGVELGDVRMGIWEYVGLAVGLENILKRKIELVEIKMMHSWVKREFEKEKQELYIA